MARLSNAALAAIAAAPANVTTAVLAAKYGVGEPVIDKHRRKRPQPATTAVKLPMQATFVDGQLVLRLSRAELLRALADAT